MGNGLETLLKTHAVALEPADVSQVSIKETRGGRTITINTEAANKVSEGGDSTDPSGSPAGPSLKRISVIGYKDENSDWQYLKKPTVPHILTVPAEHGKGLSPGSAEEKPCVEGPKPKHPNRTVTSYRGELSRSSRIRQLVGGAKNERAPGAKVGLRALYVDQVVSALVMGDREGADQVFEQLKRECKSTGKSALDLVLNAVKSIVEEYPGIERKGWDAAVGKFEDKGPLGPLYSAKQFQECASDIDKALRLHKVVQGLKSNFADWLNLRQQAKDQANAIPGELACSLEELEMDFDVYRYDILKLWNDAIVKRMLVLQSHFEEDKDLHKWYGSPSDVLHNFALSMALEIKRDLLRLGKERQMCLRELIENAPKGPNEDEKQLGKMSASIRELAESVDSLQKKISRESSINDSDASQIEKEKRNFGYVNDWWRNHHKKLFSDRVCKDRFNRSCGWSL